MGPSFHRPDPAAHLPAYDGMMHGWLGACLDSCQRPGWFLAGINIGANGKPRLKGDGDLVTGS